MADAINVASLIDRLQSCLDAYDTRMASVYDGHKSGALSMLDRYQKTADAGANLRHDIDVLKRSFIVMKTTADERRQKEQK